MTTITIRTENAHCVYHSMAEGMWENARDDGHTFRGLNLGAVIDVTPATEGITYPATFDLPDDMVEAARSVLGNCEDNNDRYFALDEEHDDDFLYNGDVVIYGEPEALRAAIGTALEYLDLAWTGGDKDDRPADLTAAMQTLEKYLA